MRNIVVASIGAATLAFLPGVASAQQTMPPVTGSSMPGQSTTGTSTTVPPRANSGAQGTTPRTTSPPAGTPMREPGTSTPPSSTTMPRGNTTAPGQTTMPPAGTTPPSSSMGMGSTMGASPRSGGQPQFTSNQMVQATPGHTTPAEYPRCSRTVTDGCVNRGAR